VSVNKNDITYWVDVGPLLPGRWGRAQMVIALSPTVVISTRITNTVTGTYFAPLLGTYGASGAELGLKVEGYRLYLPLVLR
jgi:hypothetical protein